MATQSAPPPQTPSPNQESKQSGVNESLAMTEPSKEASPKSVFVNSQPIREDQVQNAVNFLSHPRVRGSSVVHRRNFLERKGLTKEEIDEAFRRVPDPSPAVATGQSSQDAQGVPSTNIQAPFPTQAIQPVTAAPSGVMSTMARRFHWSHAVLAVGFLAFSGAGTVIVFKNAIVPRFKSWVRRVVLDEEDAHDNGPIKKPSLAEEAAAAAKAAAAAAADVAKASQEMVITKNEEKKCFAEFMTLLDVQLQEIRTMKNAIARLEGSGPSYIANRNTVRDEYMNGTVARSMPQMDARSEFDTRSVRSASPTTSNEPPHPKSYMEIMAMVQRGERPPNVRDIDDRPPNPNQPISNPSLAPRSKPWEVGQSASSTTSYVPQSQVTTNGSSYAAQDNGVTYYQPNNDSSTPWWQQRNPRITEIESRDGPTFGSGSESGSNGVVNVDHPPVRRWVPPQPPPVSMPEAAVAIRQPKSSVPKDVNLRAEAPANPIGEIDELQRVTHISESGGQLDVNGRTVSSEMSSSEIQEQVTEL